MTMLSTAPGPSPFPALGVFPRVLAFSRDPIGTLGKLFARYGNIASLVRGPAHLVSPIGTNVVAATGAAINREVLTGHDRYHAYALPGVFFPEGLERNKPRKKPITRTLTGLFHVNGNEHRRHRRLLMPAFNKTRIDAYRDDMVALTSRILDRWTYDSKLDLHEEMTRLTLAIATTTLFGEDVGEQGYILAKTMQEWLLTMMSLGMFVPLDLPKMPYRRWLDLTADIDRRTVELLAAKRGKPPGKDMLSMLLAARDEDGSALAEDELIGHTGVIFAAGHETSTNALAWTLLLLATHPEVAEQVCEELAVLKGEPPTVDQLSKLPLLEMVVKESMRILPPVPMHPRIAAEDHELAGVFIPKNTELLLSIFHMHHDPAVFPTPRRFLPSRWETTKPTVFEYNPFSAGPRMCIGAAFAIMEIKIVLAMLLQRFRPEVTPQMRVDRRVAITMAPKQGLPMIVRKADNAWRKAPRAFRGNIHDLVQLV